MNGFTGGIGGGDTGPFFRGDQRRLLRYLSRLPLFLFRGGDLGPRFGDLERRPRKRGSRCLPRLDGLNDRLLLRCLRLLGDFERESRRFDLDDDSLDDELGFLPANFVRIDRARINVESDGICVNLLDSLEFSVPGTDNAELLVSFKRRSVETSILETKIGSEICSLFSATNRP